MFDAPRGADVCDAGALEDVFGCIAQVGDQGCGFEHQLGAVTSALNPLNAQNQGFVRPGAYLAIVMVTNEDDCSARDGALFDPMSLAISDRLGPLTSYRCNEFGHLCKGEAPPRGSAAQFAAGECVSNENGMLFPVTDAANFVKSLKRDSRRILVAAIAGPTSPYAVQMNSVTDPRVGVQDQAAVVHSCTQATADPAAPEYADPGVRVAQFVSAFPGGLFLPICADSFSPALQRIAEEVGRMMGPVCFSDEIATTVAATGDPQPDCRVHEETAPDGGGIVQTLVPPCAESGGATPCWRLQSGDASGCTGGQQVAIDYGGQQPPPDTQIAVTCTRAPGTAPADAGTCEPSR